MDYKVLVFALVIAIIDWFAVERKLKSLEYICKPAVMIILIIWLMEKGSLGTWMIWFLLGAVFSLAGDIFLMLPKDLFLPGLISFLLAHISYITGINRYLPSVTAYGMILIFVVTIIAWRFYKRFVIGMEANNMGELKIPVFIYVIIISLMTISALLTLFNEDWVIQSALLISGGAILFYISDSILAWQRFVSPISKGSLKTMITYHLAQFGILIGAATHFLK